MPSCPPGSTLRRARAPLLVFALGLASVAVVRGADSPRVDLARSLPAPSSAVDAAGRRAVAYTSRVMGTYARVVLVTADSAASAPEAAVAHRVFARLDSLLSNWTETSEVARLNREAWPGPTTVESETAEILALSVRMWRESGGAYDITVEPLVRLWGFLGGTPHVPDSASVAEAFRHVGTAKLAFDPRTRTLRFTERGVRVDLGGIGKGYAVDAAAAALRAFGVRDGLVDLSGNMSAFGTPVASDAWRIGIRDPRDRLPYFARVRLRDACISTSGKYEQFVAQDGATYGHIFDPRTGRPADGLISVTVVSNSATTCDAWDTPLFVLGPRDAMRKAKEHADIAVILVQPGTAGVDTVWVEKTLLDRFALEPAAQPFFRVRTF